MCVGAVESCEKSGNFREISLKYKGHIRGKVRMSILIKSMQ